MSIASARVDINRLSIQLDELNKLMDDLDGEERYRCYIKYKELNKEWTNKLSTLVKLHKNTMNMLTSAEKYYENIQKDIINGDNSKESALINVKNYIDYLKEDLESI